MKAINIIWDIYDEENGNIDIDLPNEVEIPNDIAKLDDDEISDWLSDKYGFCHYGFSIVD